MQDYARIATLLRV